MSSEETNLFFRSGVFSFSAKIILLIFGLLYTYFIANYLGPEKYGLIVYLMSFVGTMLLLAGNESLQQILTVFIPKNNSKKLFKRVLGFALLLSLTLFTVLFFGAELIVSLIGKGTPELFGLVSLIVLLMPFSLLFYALFRGFKSFGKILKLSLFESASNLPAAILFVILLGQGMLGVLYAKMVSLTVTILISFYYFKKLPFQRKSWLKKGEIKKFAKGSLIVNFLKKVNEWTKLVFMGVFLSPVLLGFYYLLQKVSTYFINSPIVSLTEVLLPFASEKSKSKQKFEKIVSLNLKLYILLSFSLSILFVVVGGYLITLLFPKYAESIYLIPFFAVLCFLIFIQCYSTALKAINRTDLIAKGNFYTFILFLVTGYFLTSKYLLPGLLAADIIRKTVFFIYTKLNLSKLGYRIEIIPRKKDLQYFYSLLKAQVKTHLPF